MDEIGSGTEQKSKKKNQFDKFQECNWRNNCARNVLLFVIIGALLFVFVISRNYDFGTFVTQRKGIHESALNGECPDKNASFFTAGKNYHLTALASYPGSGNTWTRHLIEYISDIHTGSVYDSGRTVAEFPGERRKDASVIAIKTHKLLGGDGIVYDNSILIVRRAREAVLSFFNWRLKGKTDSVDQSEFNTTSAISLISQQCVGGIKDKKL